jgi:hypothetical protein
VDWETFSCETGLVPLVHAERAMSVNDRRARYCFIACEVKNVRRRILPSL